MPKKLNETMGNDYLIMRPRPITLTYKKHWGPRLSILCLLGDQWGRARAPNLRPSPPTEKSAQKIRVSANGYCACAEPILDLYFLAFFMVLYRGKKKFFLRNLTAWKRESDLKYSKYNKHSISVASLWL